MNCWARGCRTVTEVQLSTHLAESETIALNSVFYHCLGSSPNDTVNIERMKTREMFQDALSWNRRKE